MAAALPAEQAGSAGGVHRWGMLPGRSRSWGSGRGAISRGTEALELLRAGTTDGAQGLQGREGLEELESPPGEAGQGRARTGRAAGEGARGFL